MAKLIDAEEEYSLQYDKLSILTPLIDARDIRVLAAFISCRCELKKAVSEFDELSGQIAAD